MDSETIKTAWINFGKEKGYMPAREKTRKITDMGGQNTGQQVTFSKITIEVTPEDKSFIVIFKNIASVINDENPKETVKQAIELWCKAFCESHKLTLRLMNTTSPSDDEFRVMFTKKEIKEEKPVQESTISNNKPYVIVNRRRIK